MRYQWISRVLMNPLIGSDEVMAPFAREVFSRLAASGMPKQTRSPPKKKT